MANENISTELKTLRLIPLSKRTKEQQKRYQALETQRSRANAKNKALDAKLAKISDVATTVDEFYQLNRAEVDAEQLAAWQEQQERVLDQLHWMRTWRDQDPDDELFVGFAEGLDCLEDFIREHGFIKDGYDYSSQVLKDFEPGWAIWAAKIYNDLIWGKIIPFYKDPERLKALSEENAATRVWALFGLSQYAQPGTPSRTKQPAL